MGKFFGWDFLVNTPSTVHMLTAETSYELVVMEVPS